MAPGAFDGNLAAMTTPPDFYAIDDELTDEERMVRDNVRAFVERRIMPDIAKHYQAGTFPMELIPEFGEMGLLGANLEGYGCAGMGAVAYGLAFAGICRVEGSRI